MIQKKKSEKGVTMLSLTIAVIILLIITGMMIYNARDTIYMKNYNALKNDIELLRAKVLEFYNEYGSVPAKIPCSKISVGVEDVFNQTELRNEGDLYILDLQVLDGLTLNYGKDYEKIKDQTEVTEYYPNLYIINKVTHNIFLVGGVQVRDGNEIKWHYTDYSKPDETVVDFRYVDGIKIPDGYYYIGRDEEGSIVISNNKEDTVDSQSDNQYVWKKATGILEGVNLQQGQTLEEYRESTRKYNGYYFNEKKNQVIYLEII